MTRPIELVIFDCDGVLVDSERLAVRIDVRVLAELGWVVSEREVIDRFVGRSHEFMVAEIEAHLGRSLADDWEDEFQPLYRDAFAAELTPVDSSHLHRLRRQPREDALHARSHRPLRPIRGPHLQRQ